MSTENPTPDNGDASIHDRLMNHLAAEDSPEPDQSEPQGSDEPEIQAEEIKDDAEQGEQEQDEGPQLSTSDFAKLLGIEETALDVDADGNVSLKTKIDGKEGAAKLQDLLKSYQLQGHIDNKARQVAEQEKAIQARMQQVEQVAQQRIQQLEGLANIAQGELMREYQSIDWQTLRVTDPAEYAAKAADFQMRQGQLQQMLGTVEQAKAQQYHQQTEQYRTFLTEQAQKLPELIPEWKDNAVAETEMKALKEWGVKAGLDPQEVNTVGKAAYVAIMRKAYLYDKLQQSKAPIEAKVRAAPKLVKPGQPQTTSREQQNVASLKAQVKKTGGKAGSVAEYLLATGKV
jgi:hypothetical protein